MKIMPLLGAVVLAVSLGAGAAADPLDAAANAYAQGDYATALQDLLPLANQGLAAAQDDLGLMYHNGQGVPKDDAQSLDWYLKAANQGDDQAQLSVGFAYYEGWGVAKNGAQAVAWFSKAANQRNAAAQGMVGACYDEGFGVPRDYVTAYMWLSVALNTLGSSNPQMTQSDLQSRTNVASHMTAAQVAQAQTLANQWTPPK
jgi:TPR repeat protein